MNRFALLAAILLLPITAATAEATEGRSESLIYNLAFEDQTDVFLFPNLLPEYKGFQAGPFRIDAVLDYKLWQDGPYVLSGEPNLFTGVTVAYEWGHKTAAAVVPTPAPPPAAPTPAPAPAPEPAPAPAAQDVP